MNAPRKDGGPAFPNITPDMNIQGGPGMTLRDWFAGQALAGFMANCNDRGANGWLGILDVAARNSYAVADAMLAARETPE